MRKNNTHRKVERVLEQIRKKYNIHGRSFNGRDFFRICKTEGIELANKSFIPAEHHARFASSPLQGWILGFKGGERLLFLRSFFAGHFDVTVAFHELGHYFLNHRGNALANAFNSGQVDPLEIEADLFSEMATGRKVRRS